MLLEVHLFDFSGDLYGKLVRVEFMKKLRDEARFDNLDQLTAAIAKDSAEARGFFGLTVPGTPEPGAGRDFATSATDRIS